MKTIQWMGVFVMQTLLIGIGVTVLDAQEAVETEQQAEVEPEEEFRQEILVTTTNPDLPTIELLTSEQLEARPDRDLGEAMRQQAGMSSTRRGTINLDPQVRGLSETEVAVFVDDTRTFAAGPGRMDSGLSHVSPHTIERLEVVKGPYALTWGAGALGAIRAETHVPAFTSGESRFDGRLGLGYGDNASETDAYLGLWGSNETWRYQVSGTARSGGDYEAGDGSEVPGDYDSADLRWRLGFQAGERSLIEYVGGYQNQEDIDYPGRLLDATFFKTWSHSLSWLTQPSGDAFESIELLAYVNQKEHEMNNDEKPTAQPNPDRIPPFGLDVQLPASSDTSGGRARLAGGSGATTWTAGADYFLVEQSAFRTISRRDTGMVIFEDIVWPDAEIEDLGIYGQGVFASDNWTLAGTLRADFVEASAGEVSDFFLDNTEGALDQSETNYSAALSGNFRLGGSWLLTAGLGRAVRTAMTLERYSDRFPATKFQVAAEFMGSPDLEPEEATQLDLGLQSQGQRTSFVVEAYYRQIDNYITVIPDPSIPKRLPLSPPVVYRYISGEGANFYGAEALFDHRTTDWLGWDVSLSWIRGEDEEFNEPAFGMPPLTWRFGLRFSSASSDLWWATVHATVVDDQDRVAEARRELPTSGYELFDLVTGFNLGESWLLKAGIQNLTDEAFADHLNSLDPFRMERIPERGRNIFVGVEFLF